ncbi:MAG: hypothetical protein IKN38_10475 [Clostridia bacterium]|nr:hypothetical protein [Clostridia bacterium]
MKKVFVLMIAFALFLPSCAAEASSPLAYQRGISSVTFNARIGEEEFSLELTRGKLTVLAPEAIAGAALIRSTEKYSLIAEGEEFELPQALIPYISPVFSAFSLPEENARAAEGDGKKIAVEYGGGVYTVELSDGGKPERIGYEGVREFTLYNIIIQKG